MTNLNEDLSCTVVVITHHISHGTFGPFCFGRIKSVPAIGKIVHDYGDL